MMSTERWTALNYSDDLAIPLLGEVILLRYPISTIQFPYGPSSAVLASSHAYTEFSTTATGNPRGVRSKLHYVLILDVTHDRHNHKIKIVFSPIMSYSDPPSDLPAGSDWDAERWMKNNATNAQRLHHLSVPATDWVPPPSVSSEAPVLSFGSWVNTRPAWLAMVHVKYDILEMHKVSYLTFPVIILPNDFAVVSSSEGTSRT